MKTAREETGEKSNKKNKVGEKEENRNNTKKVVGEAGDANEWERKSEGDMDVQECDISDQNATPEDRVEWVSGLIAARRARWVPFGPARDLLPNTPVPFS